MWWFTGVWWFTGSGMWFYRWFVCGGLGSLYVVVYR